MYNLYEGESVRLRAYRKEDIPAVLDVINDPEVKLYLTPGIPFPYRLEDEAKWYDEMGKDPSKSYSFAIERKEDGQYLGGCGYNEIDWHNSVVTVGIFLSSKWHGKGYGTDTMRVLTSFVFKEMPVNKIALKVFAFNKRGIRSYEKCGFKTDGVLRQHAFRNGEYHDEVVMSLLRSEWSAGRS